MAYSPERGRVWAVITEYLQKYLPADPKVLDIGAGYCDFINNIKAKEKHALDAWKGFTKYAKGEVTTHVQSCTDMEGLDPDHFNCVFASNLLEHLEENDIKKTISEIKRVLASGGRLILIQPNFKYAYREYFDDYTHKTIFTDSGLRDMLEANGFKIIELIPRFLPFSMKSGGGVSSPSVVSIYLKSPLRPFAKQMLVVAEKK
jgi:ubiquinone/menaquinone biosynthesis C-methylase UbiE